MSNLHVPDKTLAQVRAEEPRLWEWAQDSIRSILAQPPCVVQLLIRRWGLEATHEALEACLDAGYIKFIPLAGDPDGFGVAFYSYLLDRYCLVDEDGHVRMPNDVRLDPPEPCDE